MSEWNDAIRQCAAELRRIAANMERQTMGFTTPEEAARHEGMCDAYQGAADHVETLLKLE